MELKELLLNLAPVPPPLCQTLWLENKTRRPAAGRLPNGRGLLARRAEDSRSGFSVCGRGKGYARVVVVVGGGHTRVNH